MRTRTDRRSWIGLAILLLAALGLFAAGIDWGLPGWQTWAVDAIHPDDVEKARSRGFGGGWFTRYPPLHYYLLAGVYAVSDPAVAPPAASTLARTSRRILAGRGLSVVLSLGVLVLLFLLGRRLFDAPSGLLAAALAAPLPPLVYYAKTVNLEAPYLFWFVLSLFFFVRLLAEGRSRDALCLGAAAALAVGTKDQAYAFYVLAPLPMMVFAWRRSARLWAAVRPVLLSALAGAVVLAALYLVPGNAEGFFKHLRLITGDASQPYREYETTLAGFAGLAGLTARQLLYVLGSPALLACLVGLVLSWRKNHLAPSPENHLAPPTAPVPENHLAPSSGGLPASLLVLCLSYEIFFVGVVGYSYARFQLPVCLVLTLGGGWALRELWRWGRARAGWRWAVGALVVAVLGWNAVRGWRVDAALLRDPRYAAERWIAERAVAQGLDAAGAVCVGRPRLCPRLEVVPWRRVQRRPAAFLEQRKPTWVVLNVSDLRRPPERRFYEGLLAGRWPYRRAFRTPAALKRSLLDDPGVRSNFYFLDPRIEIFERCESCAAPPAAAP